MATGFRKNAPPCSHLDTTIQMLLETPPNKGPHPKQYIKSSPHHSFRQVHRRRSSDNDKFYMDLFLQAQANHPKPAGQRKIRRSLRYIQPAPLVPTVPRLRLCSFVMGSVFISTSTSFKRTRPKKWLSCLGLSSKFLFKKVWVTQGLPCIPPGVALDKTPSTSKWKFTIGRLTSSIFNPSSLMLTELQKSLTLFDSFEKRTYLRSSFRRNNTRRN